MLLLEPAHGREDRVVNQLRPVGRLPGSHVAPTFPSHELRRRLEHDRPVVTSALPSEVIPLANADVVAEESRVPRSRVGDQGLRLGELQLELVMQELTDPTLDLFGLLAGPDEPEQ